jgi:hypothetical protein
MGVHPVKMGVIVGAPIAIAALIGIGLAVATAMIPAQPPPQEHAPGAVDVSRPSPVPS